MIVSRRNIIPVKVAHFISDMIANAKIQGDNSIIINGNKRADCLHYLHMDTVPNILQIPVTDMAVTVCDDVKEYYEGLGYHVEITTIHVYGNRKSHTQITISWDDTAN